MKKLSTRIILLTIILSSSLLKLNAQCACDNNSCTITIDSVYNGNLNLLPYDRVCIGPNGFVKGDIYLAWESKVCNYGKIYGAVTVEGKDCNGCGDENRLCNHGEIYFTKVTPGIHTRWHNYGIIRACGDIPGPKSFTINNYDGACLDVKGKYDITPGVSSWSFWRGSVTLGSFSINGGSNTNLDIYGSVVIKGAFTSGGSPPITLRSGACMEVGGGFAPGSSFQFKMEANTSLTTTTLNIGSAGLDIGAGSCVKGTAITNTGAINIGVGATLTGTSLTTSNTIKLATTSSLIISGKITMTGSCEIQVGDQSFVSANDIDLQAATKLRGPTSGYGHIDIANDLTWCCGTGILDRLDMCISNDPNKKKVTVGGQTVGPNVTWCASTITPATCKVTCPTHVTCSWNCCMALNVTGTRVNPACGVPNGSITINHTGGVGPYTYQWNDGVTTKDRTGLTKGSYWVTVLDKDSCMGIYPVNVYEFCGPTVTATGGKACPGGCVSSTATATGPGTQPYVYSWSDGKTGAGPHSFCPATTTSYTVTLTDGSGYTSTDTIIVTIHPVMNLTTTPTNAKCTGSNDGLANVAVTGGTSPFTYTWGTTGGTGATTTATLAPGTYTVTVTDSKGCTKTSTVAITEPPPVTASTSTTPALCGATDGTATVTRGGGTGPYTQTWSSPGGTTTTISGLGMGTYTVTVRDANNCSVTATALVSSTGGVSASIKSFTNATCITLGSSTVEATGGTSPYTYTWSPSGGNGATASNLTPGTYSVLVTDAIGCISTTTVTITIPPNPVPVTSKVDDNCGKSIGSVSVTVTSGTPSYTYLWSDPGSSTTTTVSNLLASDYTVTVTDASGCTATSVAVVNDLNGPTATAGSTNLTCFGSNDGTAQITASGGAGGFTYQWDSNAGNQTTTTLTGLVAGIYSVTVTDSKGCVVVRSVTITEPPAIVLATTSTDANCATANGSVTLTASGGTGTLTPTWSPSGGPGYTSTGLSADSYTITVTDATGCTAVTGAIVSNIGAPTLTSTYKDVSCYGRNDGSADITLSGGSTPYVIVWNPSTVGNGTSISNLKPGTYTLVVTDALNCKVGTIITITEPPLLSVSLPPVPQICIGQTSTITSTATGGTPAYTYNWSVSGGVGAVLTTNPTIVTTYTLTVVDSRGCTSSSATTVNVSPPLQVSAGAGKNVCAGASTSVSATGSGGSGNYTYSWEPGSFIGSTFSVTPTGSVTYTVTLTDDCGTPAVTDVVTVQPVNPLLTPQFTPDSTSGCAPLCVTFGNTTSGGVTQGCSWDFGDGNTSTNCNPTHCYNKAGFYNVSLTVADTNGCVASLTKTKSIKVHPIPVASFIAVPKSVSILEPNVSFYDKSSVDVVKWDWNFGDTYNSSSTKKNPTYTYKDTGRYKIQLIGTTIFGCKDTAIDYVYVHGDFRFYVPNAFSPNGDGKNDTFFPKGFMVNEQECYKMMIFDRWGNLIFETKDLETGWDGRANGGELVAQQDVYVWKILVCDYFDKKYSYIGHVTLVK